MYVDSYDELDFLRHCMKHTIYGAEGAYHYYKYFTDRLAKRYQCKMQKIGTAACRGSRGIYTVDLFADDKLPSGVYGPAHNKCRVWHSGVSATRYAEFTIGDPQLALEDGMYRATIVAPSDSSKCNRWLYLDGATPVTTKNVNGILQGLQRTTPYTGKLTIEKGDEYWKIRGCEKKRNPNPKVGDTIIGINGTNFPHINQKDFYNFQQPGCTFDGPSLTLKKGEAEWTINYKGKLRIKQSVLPPQWKAVSDPSSGKTYYRNRDTSDVQWDCPVYPKIIHCQARPNPNPKVGDLIIGVNGERFTDGMTIEDQETLLNSYKDGVSFSGSLVLENGSAAQGIVAKKDGLAFLYQYAKQNNKSVSDLFGLLQ